EPLPPEGRLAGDVAVERLAERAEALVQLLGDGMDPRLAVPRPRLRLSPIPADLLRLAQESAPRAELGERPDPLREGEDIPKIKKELVPRIAAERRERGVLRGEPIVQLARDCLRA